ncbi:MAG TPA: hypothetical protein P5265_00560 [Bacteroidia bacterium]|nr:hypothetical protein [Bacteroidia bacterium]HRU66964.1 hypothetical protein [Bacteroidia bacterium]
MNEKNKRISLIVSIIFYGLIAIFSAVFVYQFIVKPLPENYLGVPNYEAFSVTPKVGSPTAGLTLALVLAIIAIITIVVVSIAGIFIGGRKNIKTLISFALLVVIFIIAYVTADGSMTLNKVSETTSKLISAGLGLMTITFAVAILAIVFSEIWAFFK